MRPKSLIYTPNETEGSIHDLYTRKSSHRDIATIMVVMRATTFLFFQFAMQQYYVVQQV